MHPFSSVQSLSGVRLFGTHESQHGRLPCPSQTPRVARPQRRMPSERAQSQGMPTACGWLRVGVAAACPGLLNPAPAALSRACRATRGSTALGLMTDSTPHRPLWPCALWSLFKDRPAPPVFAPPLSCSRCITSHSGNPQEPALLPARFSQPHPAVVVW